MAHASPATRDGFAADLSAALLLADAALVPKTRAARDSVFQDWSAFCQTHGCTPSLSNVPLQETKLAYLLVYALRRRRQASAQTGKPVRAGTVEDALLAVGQGIAALGCPDPRKEAPGSLRNHPLLTSFLRALSDQDDPQTRSHPINVTILRRVPDILDLHHRLHGSANRCARDLCIIGFYWLLRPAEYLATTSHGRSQAFRLADVAFIVGSTVTLATDPSCNDLDVSRITRATLTFDDQKNAVRGEQISHAATAETLLCPCKALARLCQHLRNHNAPSSTPLCTYYDGAGQPRQASPSLITNALRHAAIDVQHLTGIDPFLISARSLRPGGATALLCAGIDPDVIQLLGRWKSDAMLRYLRVAAHANTHNFAQRMLDAGAFTFAPAAYTAAIAQPVPQEAPRDFLAALHRSDLYDA